MEIKIVDTDGIFLFKVSSETTGIKFVDFVRSTIHLDPSEDIIIKNSWKPILLDKTLAEQEIRDGHVLQVERHHTDPTHLYTIIAYGISDSLPNAEALELFSKFGKIKSITFTKTPDGKRDGSAKIEYFNQESAVRAFHAMNHFTIHGVTIALEPLFEILPQPSNLHVFHHFIDDENK